MLLMRETISRRGTTISGVQRRPSSSGMNSIKRTTTSSSTGKLCEAFHLVVVEPRSRTQLTLRGVRPAARAARSPLSTIKTAGNASDALEGGRVHGVHADGHTMEAGVVERRSQRLEEMAVGGEGQIKRFAGNGAQAGEFADEFDQPAAQQRFAAGEANFGDAQRDKKLDEPQVLFDAQLGILRADFPSTAVDTLVVAAVGDGDAQIMNDPAVAVGQPGLGMLPKRQLGNGVAIGRHQSTANHGNRVTIVATQDD